MLDLLFSTNYFIEKLQKTEENQRTYCIEECSEFIKELCKMNRGRGDIDHAIEEACDVIATSYAYLKLLNIADMEITERIEYKYNRAVERIEKVEI